MNQFGNNSNLFSKKVIWKRILVILALIIVGVSFFYMSRLVRELSLEERKKVRLWAEAIESRANTVNKTVTLFLELAKVERQKIEIWARATEILIDPSDFNPNDNALAVEIIESNTNIPIILTDDGITATGERNVDGVIDLRLLQGEERELAQQANQILLDSLLQIWKKEGDVIDITFLDTQHTYLYHKDSRILEELRATFNNIQTEFVNDIISMAASTPVIYLKGDSVIAYNLVDSLVIQDSVLLNDKLRQMSNDNDPIIVDLGYEALNYIYFSDSDTLTKIRYYTGIQIGVVVLFVLIGYWLFSIFRRSEQNKVWVGMAKETAHQLGTPLSSLMGWMEILRMKKIGDNILVEMEKDVDRLNMITDRFSKIGAKPNLEPSNVVASLEKFETYFKTRIPRKVDLTLNSTQKEIISPMNEPLFHWVIENLCKNGIDAMEGKGSITIDVFVENSKTIVEVTDTGKGIPSNKRKEVFQPGITSKERGWGLGLSLSKRIVKEYHKGSIFVKWSELEVGTTFRIELNQ